MTERYAIYFAPPAGSALDRAADGWLAQTDLADATISARRYLFHATIKAPMRLAAGTDRVALEAALRAFAGQRGPVDLGPLAVRPIEGFLALVPVAQSMALTHFATDVVRTFEPFRAPMSAVERERRLAAPLSARQIALLDAYGYPFTHEEFRFHMTLTDRLDAERRPPVEARAQTWFAPVLAEPVRLDRLVLFREPAPGAPFERLSVDFVLDGTR